MFAAIEFRPAEIDVPPGFGAIRRVASAFPDFFAPWYGFATTMVNLFSNFVQPDSDFELEESLAEPWSALNKSALAESPSR